MRPLIDDIRLLERRTTTNNDQEKLPESLNFRQENKQKTREQLHKVDFQRVSETGNLAPGRVKNSVYLKDDAFLPDKPKQNRTKDCIKVDVLTDYLNVESKNGQRQRRKIKDYIEVKDLKELLKDRP